MNYINQLQDQVSNRDDVIGNTRDVVVELRKLIASDKHTGVDCEGNRKDWIATMDVESFCVRLLTVLNEVEQ
jgi:hypothetical protein